MTSSRVCRNETGVCCHATTTAVMYFKNCGAAHAWIVARQHSSFCTVRRVKYVSTYNSGTALRTRTYFTYVYTLYTLSRFSHATRCTLHLVELRADGGGPEFGPMLVSLASVLALFFIHTYTKVLYG